MCLYNCIVLPAADRVTPTPFALGRCWLNSGIGPARSRLCPWVWTEDAMTYEEYAERGYEAIDYTNLSQLERWHGIVIKLDKRKEREIAAGKRRNLTVVLSGPWFERKKDEEGDWARPADWWKFKHWRWGVDESQTYTYVRFGPVWFLMTI